MQTSMDEMPALAQRSRLRYAAFIALALAINTIDGMITRSAGDGRRQLILALASSFDIVFVVVALYYWLLARTGIRTNASMIVVGLLAVARAGFLFPAGGVKIVLAGVCELGFIGFVMICIQRFRKANRQREADPLDAIRTTVRTILPVPIAVNALSGELAALYYALFSWRAEPHAPPDAQAVTAYKKAGQVDLLTVLPIACVLEMIPTHLLLQRWSAGGAWVATAVSAYGLIWMVGVARSFRLRPTLIDGDYVHLRYGLIFQLQVPRSLIARSRRAVTDDIQFAVPRNTEPTHCLEFAREVTAEGLFGFQRRLTRVALAFDDPVAVDRALSDTPE